ncbi:MAG: ImmA/IrrE family metallo-endopeptidase [Desulfobacterales bacterium]|jgi:Zn-dependent peptidase ImmA (M78 family)
MKVPWLPKSGIEAIAGDVLSGYEMMTGSPVAPPIPVEDVIERYLNLRIGFMDFEQTYGFHEVLGAIYVKDRLIYADNTLLAGHSEGRLNFTFAHEAGHWVLHRKFVTDTEDSRAERTAILCRKKDAKKPLEWQADYFAACLLMPEKWIKSAFEKTVGIRPLHLHNTQRSLTGFVYIEPCVCNWPFIAQAIQKTGGFSNVSKQAIIIRLQELGLVINETTAEIGWSRKQYAT